jgi:hypothetical protein
MSTRWQFFTIITVSVLSMLVSQASALVADQAVREQASNVVRSQPHLKPDQFLGVQRDEKLEQLLTGVPVLLCSSSDERD